MNVEKKIMSIDLSVGNTYNEAIPMPPNNKGRILFSLKNQIVQQGLLSIRPLGIVMEYRNFNAGISNALLRDTIDFKAAYITNTTTRLAPITGIGNCPKDVYYADKLNKAVVSDIGSNDTYQALLITNLRQEPNIADTDITAKRSGFLIGKNAAAGNDYDLLTQDSQAEIPADILNNTRVSTYKFYLLKAFFELELVSNKRPDFFSIFNPAVADGRRN